MLCDFIPTGDRQYTCSACGRVVKRAPQSPRAICRTRHVPGDPPTGGPRACCGDQAPEPTWWRRAWNLASAAAEFIAAPGFVDANQYHDRLAICDACPHRLPERSVCGLCGCYLPWKAKGAAWRCPLGKWPGDRPAGPPLTRFNLHYFICPLRHSDNVWQWNVAQLRKRLHRFNGRRLVTIASGHVAADIGRESRARAYRHAAAIASPENVFEQGTCPPRQPDAQAREQDPPTNIDLDPADQVIEAFGSDASSIEFSVRPNNFALREAAHFLPALRELASVDPAEATFFAHAKGVSRGRNRQAIRLWTEAMYRQNLDRFDDVRELLRRWPCVGIAKRYHAPDHWTGQQSHGWHYAGSFWWANHAALFSRPGWDAVLDHGWATEAYPGTVFTADEAFCLAKDNIAEPYNLAEWAANGGG